MDYSIEQYEQALDIMAGLSADSELIKALTVNYNNANFAGALALAEIAIKCKLALQNEIERGITVNTVDPLAQFESEPFKPRTGKPAPDDISVSIEIPDAAKLLAGIDADIVRDDLDSAPAIITPPAPAPVVHAWTISELYSALNSGGEYILVFKKTNGEITTRRAVNDPGAGCYNKGGSKLPSDRLLFWDCDAMAKKSAILKNIISFESVEATKTKAG